jgi:hypothetical protein
MIPFSTPVNTALVPNYYMYVREPMDLSKIKSSLESHSYKNYWEPVVDLRLMFRNARVYNEAHMSTDTISKKVYENALMFEEKLEGIVWADYSITLCDALHKYKTTDGAQRQKEQELILRTQREEAERQRIYEEHRKQLIATDAVFALGKYINLSVMYIIVITIFTSNTTTTTTTTTITTPTTQIKIVKPKEKLHYCKLIN